MESKSVIIGSTASNRPYGVLTVTEIATSVANNTSTVSINLVLKRPYSISSSATKTASCTVNGQVYNWNGTIGGQGDKTLISTTQVIGHNSDGTKTIGLSASIQLDINWGGVQLGTITGSDTMALTNLPRYATVTQSATAKTETTISMKWTSDSVIDYIWYSTNNGSTWHGIDVADGTNGTYIISNLYSNSTYYVKTRVRRKDSQMTTDSSTLTVTTYAYPYANNTPNFTIGDKLTIGIFNPLNRTVNVALLGADNSVCGTIQTSGTSVSGYTEASVQNVLYASIPNSQTGVYKVRVTYGTQISTNNGGTYKVNAGVCSPTITSVAYADTNATVTAITGDDQDIVRNHSTVNYTANGLTALKNASIASCSVTVNGSTYNLSISGNNASGGGAVIDSGSDVEAVFTVTDSRGLTGTKKVNVTMLDWFIPSAIITLQRHNNFYTETDLNVDANYASINGNNQVTITYEATKDGDSTASVSGTVQDNVTTVISLDNSYSWTVKVILTDLFGGTATYTAYISRGMPITYFDRIKSSVGINCFPANAKTLEIDGDVYINSNQLSDFIIEEGTSSNWKYAKYASGKVEAWAYVEINSSSITWNAYLSTGLNYGNTRIAYPFNIYNAVIMATAGYMGGAVGWVSTANPLDETQTSVTMVRNGNTGTINLSLHVIGTLS